MKSLHVISIITLLALGSLTSVHAAQTTDVKVTEKRNSKYKLQEHAEGLKSTFKTPTITSFSSKNRESIQSYPSSDFWIFDAWFTYDNDVDYDGYYSSFTLEFDADSVYSRAPVYAVIYLGKNDLYDPIYVTSVFDIYGDASDDSLILENELISGYPNNDYDILIELYDAHTEQLVAFVDAYDDADLAYTSLESMDYEVVYTEPEVVVVTEHGGSLGWISVVLLAGIAVYRLTCRK